MDFCSGRLSRRQLLATGGALGATAVLSPMRAHAAGVIGSERDTDTRLRVVRSQASLLGAGAPATKVWTYNETEPGPLLRVRQGTPMRVLVENQLDEGTTIHWHGIRLPNAMDGVPGLTQPLIEPGTSFAYEFTPPDAGTFWYHSHANSQVQLGRGLAGALIIEEKDAPAVDRDELWFIQDWRLTDGQIAPGFGNRMEEAMSGRVGNTVTINGRKLDRFPVRAGERVRLRLVNAALARVMALRFERHRPVVIALDGQPCDPHEPDGGRVVLGPAMRADVILDLEGEPGRDYAVTDDFYDGLAYTLVRLSYETTSPLRSHPLDAPVRLTPNPLPQPDLASAEHHEMRVQGGMAKNMGMMPAGGAIWAINGMSMTGDGQAGMPAMFRLRRGQSCVLDLNNESAWWHPMHLHGHSFQVLTRNGAPVQHREWGDTVLVQAREVVRVAFVADNPGDWMLHCHVADHQMTGLMTIIRVA